MIDLRSDTVTKPSQEMLRAMVSAEVGDDVFGEDPTVNSLQTRVAQLFGKESALFVPTGTMGNEICIKAHTQHGDEIIVEQDSHIFIYETAAPALLSGVQMNPVAGKRGVMDIDKIKKAIRPKAYFMPSTRLICIENTHGRSAGSIYPIDEIKKLRDLSLENDIKLHLDGARLWNASVASGISVKEYAKYVDSVSVCFSKGLGAPIGSIVIGNEDFIERARRFRKIWGGGMRQAGILAAAAHYALDHNIDRLKDDHQKAKYLAKELSQLKQLTIDLDEVQTNMVIMDIMKTEKTQNEVLNLLKQKGLLLTSERYSCIRAVMHLDVSLDNIQEAARIFKTLFR